MSDYSPGMAFEECALSPLPASGDCQGRMLKVKYVRFKIHYILSPPDPPTVCGILPWKIFLHICHPGPPSALLPGSERGWESHGTHQSELEPWVQVPVSQNCRPDHCSKSQAPHLWYGDGNGTSLTEMKCWEESVYRAPKTEPDTWDNQTPVSVPS